MSPVFPTAVAVKTWRCRIYKCKEGTLLKKGIRHGEVRGNVSHYLLTRSSLAAAPKHWGVLGSQFAGPRLALPRFVAWPCFDALVLSCLGSWFVGSFRCEAPLYVADPSPQKPRPNPTCNTSRPQALPRHIFTTSATKAAHRPFIHQQRRQLSSSFPLLTATYELLTM